MEHFCNEHQTKFFKTAKMSGYAHPIKVEDQTVGWCNEDAKEVARLPAQKTASPPLQEDEPVFKSKDKQIAEHVWWKELGNRIGDGSLEKDYPTKAVKIKHEYYKKMSEVIGVSFK